MRKITITIERDNDAALAEMGRRFVHAWKTGKSESDWLSFESIEGMFRALTPARWETLKFLQERGANSIRGLARDMERDVHRVHDDVTALKEHGLVAETEDGKVHVPYDVIHTEFDLVPKVA